MGGRERWTRRTLFGCCRPRGSRRGEHAGQAKHGGTSLLNYELVSLTSVPRGDFLFGIRSMKASGQNGVIYHCLVNKAADDIAKAHGSKLTDWQVDIFKGIVALFGTKRADEFHLQDFVELKANHKGVTNEEVRVFVEQLVKDFWLSRPHNTSEYRLGVRTYVELPELLKSYDLFVPQVIYH